MSRCSGISLGAAVLNGIVAFCYPSYAGNQWQTYCIYVAVSTITSRSSHSESLTQTAGFSQLIRLVIPVFFSARMHAMAQLSLYLSLAGYLIFFIVALVMHKSRMPTSFLVESGLGNSGWSPGTAWLLSISNSMYAFGGIDGGWCSLRRPAAKANPITKSSISPRRCPGQESAFLNS